MFFFNYLNLSTASLMAVSQPQQYQNHNMKDTKNKDWVLLHNNYCIRFTHKHLKTEQNKKRKKLEKKQTNKKSRKMTKGRLAGERGPISTRMSIHLLAWQLLQAILLLHQQWQPPAPSRKAPGRESSSLIYQS